MNDPIKPIYNYNISPGLWMQRFNRETLRNIAKMHGIKQGRNTLDVARNLCNGTPLKGDRQVVFEMDLYMPTEEKPQ